LVPLVKSAQAAEAGAVAAEYMDRVMRNLTCRRIQVDELWGFCYAKERNVTPSRLRYRVQTTTDGHRPYREAVESASVPRSITRCWSKLCVALTSQPGRGRPGPI
jgi:hypothetical protein